MTKRTMRVTVERWPLSEPFRLASRTVAEIEPVVVTLTEGDHVGRGEGIGVHYRGERLTDILECLEKVRPAIESGADRDELQTLLDTGGARNALDCALWDLEAKQVGQPVWSLARLSRPCAIETMLGCGADTPERMAARAILYHQARAIKLKLTGEPVDADRVRAVRAARPDVKLSVDGNRGFTLPALEQLLPVLAACDVKLIEQPFPIGDDHWLDGLDSPVPIAADESAQGLADLAGLVGRFQCVNIKLDKCGGLTEALAMARAARNLGLDTMVGNMFGTSLAMAPAFLVGQLCSAADLDGPIFLTRDRIPAAAYSEGYIDCPGTLWGGAEECEGDAA